MLRMILKAPGLLPLPTRLSQPTLRERRNGRRVVDCREKGRVATDIATYECSIYRVENEHDVVIGPRLHRAPVLVTVYLKWEIASRNYGLLLFSLLCSIPLHPATRSLPGLLPTLYPNTRVVSPNLQCGMGKSVIAGRLRATFARNHNYT